MLTSKITEIGSLVPDFKDDSLLVLFGETAPSELKDISVIHKPEEDVQNVIKEGGTLTIGDNQYTIQKVGGEANNNFDDLGHLSIYFGDDDTSDILPGAILVTPNVFPEPKQGDTITFA